jgi:hypothetical protein
MRQLATHVLLLGLYNLSIHFNTEQALHLTITILDIIHRPVFYLKLNLTL